MAQRSIYEDIARRTGGDIYIGVVGPVRSGKSTFITRFMQELVLPNIGDAYSRERARDEMPQSAAGLTVMTTEPKFVPDEAVSVSLDGGVSLRVKMIDCVGYMIPEALGAEENGTARMVKTPWQEEPMPFEEAAELGTRRVITEHATIGILVSSDGTVGELPRSSFELAEARLVKEMKALRRPFAIVLNSAEPTGEAALSLAQKMEESYGVPVALVNCQTLNAEDICGILSIVLGEFPVTSVGVSLPPWVRALEADDEILRSVTEDICRIGGSVRRMGDVTEAFAALMENENVAEVKMQSLDMGTGRATLAVSLQPSLYYGTAARLAGQEIADDAALLTLLRELSDVRCKYARVAQALEAAENEGYGIVMPREEDLHLETPTIVRHQGGFGVKLRAAAKSLHIIRADIAADLSPVVGTEAQSEAFLQNIKKDLEEDPARLWHSNMFGKSLFELVSDALCGKLAHMPPEARQKLAQTLERIINEGSNGLICILL